MAGRQEASMGHQDAHLDYVCGAGASLVNIVFTFPINKTMFRQQVEGIRVHKAVRQLRKEGLRNIYRGLLPPLMQRTMTVSIMFGTYTSYIRSLEYVFPSTPYYMIHSLAAMGAGFTEAVLVPFERVQCLLQVKQYNTRLHNTKHAFQYLWRYGPSEYYRGLSAILLRNGLSNILFLGLREPLKDSLPTPKTQLGESFNAFISGAGLGAGLSTLFFPLNVVKSRMQTHLGGRFVGMRETFDVVFEERNRQWRKIFRGVQLNYTRAFVSWGIINTTYELLQKLLTDFV